jgi:hypothetical protein
MCIAYNNTSAVPACALPKTPSFVRENSEKTRKMMEWIIDWRWFSPFHCFSGDYQNSPNGWRFIPVCVCVGPAALCAPWCCIWRNLMSYFLSCNHLRLVLYTQHRSIYYTCPSHVRMLWLDLTGYRFHKFPIYQFLDENLQLHFLKIPPRRKLGGKCVRTQSLWLT